MLKLAKCAVALVLLLTAIGCGSQEHAALEQKCNNANNGASDACQQMAVQNQSIGTQAEAQDGHPLRRFDNNAILSVPSRF